MPEPGFVIFILQISSAEGVRFVVCPEKDRPENECPENECPDKRPFRKRNPERLPPDGEEISRRKCYEKSEKVFKPYSGIRFVCRMRFVRKQNAFRVV